MNSVHFNYLYNYEHSSDTYVPPHTHNIYEMVFYNSGKGKSNTDKGVFHFSPGHCILYAPSLSHDEVHESYTNVDCVGFYLENNSLPTIHFDSQTTELFDLKKRLGNELRDRMPHYSNMINLIIKEMVIYMLRRSNLTDEQQPVPCIDYATKFIDENFYNDVDIKKLAMIQGYSYEHFRHIFKSYCGISPKQYLIRKRVECARTLLSTTDIPVTSVALQSGFDNLSMFSFIFKKHTGTAPSEYRSLERTPIIASKEAATNSPPNLKEKE